MSVIHDPTRLSRREHDPLSSQDPAFRDQGGTGNPVRRSLAVRPSISPTSGDFLHSFGHRPGQGLSADKSLTSGAAFSPSRYLAVHPHILTALVGKSIVTSQDSGCRPVFWPRRTRRGICIIAKSSDGHCSFNIALSIEVNDAAHRTLRLRNFLHKFPLAFPTEYYNFLNGDLTEEPDWSAAL